MKNSFRFFTLVIILILFVFQTDIQAFDTYDGHTLEGGVGNWGANRRYYWIDSTASPFTTLIDQAMSEWVNTSTFPGISTPISFRKTTYRPSSSIDVFYGTYFSLPTEILAETRFFRYSDEIIPFYINWRWTTIELNKPKFDLLPINSYGNHKQGTIAHEMGHAMGLYHTIDIYVIMCPYAGVGPGYERRVTRGQVDDLNGINYLYP